MLAAMWAEPRPARPPVRVWRDWALVRGSRRELGRRDAAARRQGVGAALVVSVSVVVAQRACCGDVRSPLAAVAVAFGALLAFDIAKIVAIDATGLLSIAGLLVLPYALLRWGAGREAALGLGIILIWLPVTLVADPTSPPRWSPVTASSCSRPRSVRQCATAPAAASATSSRCGLRQRNELARELHDTVGHRVSAIAVQAQAGRALSRPQILSARWRRWSPSRKRRPGRSRRCEPWSACCATGRTPISPPAGRGGHRTARSPGGEVLGVRVAGLR